MQVEVLEEPVMLEAHVVDSLRLPDPIYHSQGFCICRSPMYVLSSDRPRL